MSKKIKEKDVLDLVYNSAVVGKFINYIMKKGKKELARKIVYGSFDIIQQQTKQEPLSVFTLALKNTSPNIEVRSKKVGGANYQVPTEVNKNRKMFLGMQWIIQAAEAKKGGVMKEKLANEIIKASQEEGEAIKRKINVHKMAEANKAFAHFSRLSTKKR